MFEFQIAKNNRLKVYRQTFKQEMAEGGGTSADDVESLKSFDESVASFGVGGKKLMIPSSSSAASSSRAAVCCAETKPKLLLLGPLERKQCDKTVDGDKNNNDDCVRTANIAASNTDVSQIASSVSDIKLEGFAAAVSNGCSSNKTAVADADLACTETDAVSHVDETAVQTDTVAVTRRGRRAAKKPASAAGKKGTRFVFVLALEMWCNGAVSFSSYVTSWIKNS